MNLKKKNIRKLLIVTLSNLGDVVLTLPVLAAIRQALPQAVLHVVVGEKALELLNGNAALPCVRVYNKQWTLRQKLQFIRTLRAERYDFVLDFRNSLIPYLLGRPSKSFSLNRSLRTITSRYERSSHLISLLGLSPAPPGALPLFTPTDTEPLLRCLHSQGLFNLQNILLVAPGARLPLKRWPARHFAELIKMIVGQAEMSVVLVGDSSECAMVNEVEQLLGRHDVVNICGKISQKELAALIERSRLILSNDSAIMHLGCYYGRPVLAFFGPTDDKKYGSRTAATRIATVDIACRPCEKSQCAIGKKCLEDLTPQQVWPLVIELLKKK